MPLFKDKYRIETTRLKGWDYASAGWYFVTICTRNRELFFGDVIDGEMNLSAMGEIACDYWQEIPQHTPAIVRLDAFVVMPNHIHGIIVIEKNAEAETLYHNVSIEMSRISPKSGSLGVIMRIYKSAMTTWCHENKFPVFDWQERYHDHIIRNQRSLDEIRQYIADNPAKWELDKSTPANLWM